MKDHVRANFDVSPRAYATYESRTGRFETLATRLAAELERHHRGPLDRLLDAGAGSGASTRALEAEAATVVALDISQAMLRENATKHRIQADFDAMPFVDDCFDSVAFTASLFLTPVPDRAATEAHRILRAGGTVGAVAPLGWTTADGEDVFATLERSGQSPSPAEDVEAALDSQFEVESGEWTFETTADDLRLFHAIPAMAARLYPKLELDARVDATQELLESVEGPLQQRWRWLVGTSQPDG